MGHMKFSDESPQDKVLEKDKRMFNFLNMHSLYLFYNNSVFQEAVSFEEALNFPDGGTIARKLHIKRQRGPDFTRKFLMSDFAKKKKHFFIGLNENESGKLSEVTGIDEKNIGAYNPPYVKEQFSKEERKKISEKVNKFGADYLWICVGNPKQEILGYQLFEDVNVDKIFNVGAALDFILGRKKESPKFWQRVGLEWLYLGFTNPKRTLKKIRYSFIALKHLGKIRIK